MEYCDLKFGFSSPKNSEKITLEKVILFFKFCSVMQQVYSIHPHYWWGIRESSMDRCTRCFSTVPELANRIIRAKFTEVVLSRCVGVSYKLNCSRSYFILRIVE